MCALWGLVFFGDEEAAEFFKAFGTGLRRVEEPVSILLLLLLFLVTAGFMLNDLFELLSFSLISSLWLIHSKSVLLASFDQIPFQPRKRHSSQCHPMMCQEHPATGAAHWLAGFFHF